MGGVGGRNRTADAIIDTLLKLAIIGPTPASLRGGSRLSLG